MYHSFISISSFSLISVFTSLILVLINVINNFNSVCCFNCGFRGVSSQSQHEFELEDSGFVGDWTNHVGAPSVLAVAIDLNDLTNERQKEFELRT